jgi:hypothetical protein
MPQQEPIVLSQPENSLSSIAEAQRRILTSKNDYKTDANEYSNTNADALSDGDEMGKGTGLDIGQDSTQGGSSKDIFERKSLITKNKFAIDKPYTTPSV